MDKKMVETVMSNTYTRTGFLRRMAFLRSYLERRNYSKSGNIAAKFGDYLLERGATQDDVLALRNWVKGFGSAIEGKGFHATLNSLVTIVRQLPTVSLFLPVVLAEDELVKIGLWFRKHIKSNLMLDVRVDPTYVGGCGLVYRGYFKDYSLRRVFLNRKDEIKRLLDDYEKTEDKRKG